MKTVDQLIDLVRCEWLGAKNSLGPLRGATLLRGVEAMYQLAGLPLPEFVMVVDSPEAMGRARDALSGQSADLPSSLRAGLLPIGAGQLRPLGREVGGFGWQHQGMQSGRAICTSLNGALNELAGETRNH